MSRMDDPHDVMQAVSNGVRDRVVPHDEMSDAYNGGHSPERPHGPPAPPGGTGFAWGLLAVLVVILAVWWL